MEPLTLRDAIGYWEFHNRTEGKSRDTIAWYNHALGTFERFLESAGKSTALAQVGEPEVRAYIAHLQQRRKWEGSDYTPTSDDLITPGGIQNRIRALKAFFNWLHREGYTKTYRLKGLSNYKVPTRVVDVLVEEEIRRVLAACDTRTEWGARAHAILTLMLDAGLRISEVTGLRTADLNSTWRVAGSRCWARAARSASSPSGPRRSGQCGATCTTTARSHWARMSTSS